MGSGTKFLGLLYIVHHAHAHTMERKQIASNSSNLGHAVVERYLSFAICMQNVCILFAPHASLPRGLQVIHQPMRVVPSCAVNIACAD